MLSTVNATRFDRLMSTGKTKPALLACQRADGVEVEVVTKFSAGCERGVTALAIEAVLAMLAADLDLPTPEPVLVHVDPDVIDPTSSKFAHELAKKSVSPAYGSVRLPAGFSAVVSDKRFDGLVSQAAEILAFDGMVLNPDRRISNPNCQCDGKHFAIFDHEAALVGLEVLGTVFQPYPWTPGALRAFGQGPGQHVLFTLLSGKDLQFDRFTAAWAIVTDARLAAYKDALPKSWDSAFPVVDQALSYLGELRNHIPAVLDEVRRILQ